MIIWGNCICMVGLFNEDKKISMKIIKYLILYYSCFYSNLISSSIIFAINKEKGAFTIHYNDLYEGNLFEKNPCQIDKFLPHTHLCFQNGIPNTTLSTFIKCKNSIYFIEDNQCIKSVSLLSWDIPVKNLKRSQNYINAMRLTMDIYKGDVRSYSEIPIDPFIKNEQFRALIQEITEEFLKKYYENFWSSEATSSINTQSHDQNARDENFILMVIEFLVETEQYDYLFKKIMTDFEKMAKEKQFMECLEPFIISQKIK